MLYAGIAAVDITPSPGSLMACFPTGPQREPRRAAGVHDPLSARVLALSDGEERVAICSVDATMVREIDVARIREMVTVPGARIMLCATHTHSSPENAYLFGNTPDDPWIAQMNQRIAAAVITAFADMKPATLRHGTATAALSHNRRVNDAQGRSQLVMEYREGTTNEPVDPEAAVLRVDDKGGQPLTILYNFTAHALCAGPRNMLYTADYPGVANGVVERRFRGAMALFTNGAAGNVHPRACMRPDFTAVEQIGQALGRVVADCAVMAAPVDDTRMRLHTETMQFANRMDPSLQVAVELACLHLGPLAIGFLPGEVFVEFQLEFKRQLAPHSAFLVGYANGWPGYIPTQGSYPAGGYGVDACATDPPALSRTALPVGAGEMLIQRLLEMAKA